MMPRPKPTSMMPRKRGRPLNVVQMSVQASSSKLQKIINDFEPVPHDRAAELLTEAAELLNPRRRSRGRSRWAADLEAFGVSSLDPMRSHTEEAVTVLIDQRHGLLAALNKDVIFIIARYYQEPDYIIETDRGLPYGGRSRGDTKALLDYNKYNVEAEARWFDGFVRVPANVYVPDIDRALGARFLVAQPPIFTEIDQHQYQGFERENIDGTLSYVMLARIKTTIRRLDATDGLTLCDHVWLRRPAMICPRIATTRDDMYRSCISENRATTVNQHALST
jgi:hypothetical protein